MGFFGRKDAGTSVPSTNLGELRTDGLYHYQEVDRPDLQMSEFLRLMPNGECASGSVEGTAADTAEIARWLFPGSRAIVYEGRIEVTGTDIAIDGAASSSGQVQPDGTIILDGNTYSFIPVPGLG